jgi:hypothetical protein
MGRLQGIIPCMRETTKPHMFGAYGMFWDREEVNWNPGSGPSAWQLLGRVNYNKPALRVCDFRRAQGFYVLFDEFRANYVGLARGTQGIGARLRNHHSLKDGWQRFCWFAFDDVVDHRMLDGWSRLQRKVAVSQASAELVLRECEALLITILGSKAQNEMRFQAAKQWDQLRQADLLHGGIAGKVDAAGFTDQWWRKQAEDA